MPSALAHAEHLGHAGHQMPGGNDALLPALAAVGLHSLAMLAVAGVLAVVVYQKVGVEVLRRAWINLDFIWVGTLIVVGSIALGAGSLAFADWLTREDGGFGEVYIAFGNLEAITPATAPPPRRTPHPGSGACGSGPWSRVLVGRPGLAGDERLSLVSAAHSLARLADQGQMIVHCWSVRSMPVRYDGSPVRVYEKTSNLTVIGDTLRPCDPCGIPSTSPWTGAAIIGPWPRTKSCIVTRPRPSRRPMPSSLAGSPTN